jgi:PAS domain S-box-containing protein
MRASTKEKKKPVRLSVKESEIRYRRLFEAAQDGILILNAKTGMINDVNPFLIYLLGYSREEFIKKKLWEVGAFKDIKASKDAFLDLQKKAYIRYKDLPLRTKDGKLVQVEFVSNVYKAGGEDVIQCNIRDITERKQTEEELRQSEARFRILFEQARDVILKLEITPEGTPMIREMNSETLKVLGYDRDELIGRPVSFIAGAPDPAKVIGERRQNGLSEKDAVFEVKHRCKDGTIRVFESSVAEMKIDSKNYAISVERDVTERTRSVDRIRRQFEHLTAMSAIDRDIAASYDLVLTLSEILVHVTTELGLDAADIWVLDSTSKMLRFYAEHGFRTKAARKEQIPLDESYAGRAALERHLVHISNLRDEPEGDPLAARWKGEEFVCYYGVPLIFKGQVKGVLEAFHRTTLEPDAEWLDFLDALAGQTAIAIENSTLFESLRRSNIELALAYDATIEGWSRALDLRDKETEGHTQRVAGITVRLARAFGLSEEELVQARWGALLHDIGKLGVPDGILLKPGPLTNEEWVAMKKHPTFAYEMISPIGYLRLALDIPYCHHEEWDGTGYPRGLKGAQIPLIARIFAVVDMWDALRSDRPYRAAWKEEKVCEHIRSLSGTHFEPQVVDVFMQNLDSFEASSIPS